MWEKEYCSILSPSHRGSSSVVKDNDEMSFAVLPNDSFLFKKMA